MICPNLGPTFEIAKAGDQMDVKKSKPLKDKKSADNANVKKSSRHSWICATGK